jgi:hypothetical protein
VWSSPEAAALSPASTRWTPPTRGRRGPLHGHWYRGLDTQPLAALQVALQSPPPLNLSSCSGSGGRSSEAEWGGGARHAMQVSGHPGQGLYRTAGAPSGRPCTARGVAALWATSGGEREIEGKGRLRWRRGRCGASGVDQRGWEKRCRLHPP